MTILLRYALILLLATGSTSLLARPLAAQDVQGPLLPAASAQQPLTIDQLNSALESIKQSLASKNPPDDSGLAALRTKALSIQQQADQLGSNLAPQNESLNEKLAVLGPAPDKTAPPEAPEVIAQRKQLNKASADLDAQVKQTKTLSVEATQLVNQIAGMRRDLFEAQLSQRTASPLSESFWTQLTQDLSDDKAALTLLGTDSSNAAKQAWQPPNRTPFIVCLIVTLLLLAGGKLIERGGLQLTSRHVHAGRLRRSAMAMLVALVTALVFGFAAHMLYLAFDWNETLGADLNAMARSLVRQTFFAAYMAGLGRALLCATRPSWRLPPLSDDAARRLRPFPWLLAGCVLLIGIVEQINNNIGASLTAIMAVTGLLSLLISGLIAAMLFRLGRARRALLAAGEVPAKRPLWVGLLIAGAFIGVGLSWLCVATGYIALAFYIAKQMMRVGLIVATLYLLMNLVHDVFETLFSPRGYTGKRIQDTFGVTANRLEQTSTVLSGVCRAILFLLAVALAITTPYNAGPEELVNRTSQLFADRAFGALKIVPGDILTALLVCLIGLQVVHIIKYWLSHQLLPKTSLDHGLQNSIVTLLGYVGGVLVFVLVLVALQVNVQSIAWIASALSVGIGFGLQAIVQNFVSGLILLAERPVKVGDWVSLSGVEGDIRRINVRATEIQMSDRSTVIVPNSQLITQNVRNVTLASAQGRVQVKLPMPLSTDAGKVRQIILDVFSKHPATLDTPTAYVQLENIDAAAMTFNCVAYVKSPRDSSNVKSDLLFELIERLRAAKIPMSSPQNMVVRTLRDTPDDG
ncbi:DUF3772 domain-containing protein [Dyella tabacisoli]|uniref:Mechanosensitive ion channel family protein n=1 Tax=Dyella tabacisoli TaxID=2282381 RepID=A0A369UUF9_9GAMM|nr:DUF3772 domain-containing protein [Dyella tabacisoli]RDD83358.1 mechanosensitive ion channel family protein [Dyella tabacisoli]